MEKFRFLTSGESHGKCLNAIIEGVPAGFRIKASVINEDLARRQVGYGRGGRMKIEKDMRVKDELPRSVGVQYSTGEERRNSSRRK